MSNNYSTPSWTDGTTPAINAANLKAMGEAVERACPLYGVCSTAAATTAKTVTVSFTGTLALFAGLAVTVKFSNSNTAAAPTLNVNGTGAKAIKAYGTTASGVWTAGQVLSFTYDGTYWQITGVNAFTQNQTLSAATKAAFNSAFGTTPNNPDEAFSAIVNLGAKIETGTYVGTGSRTKSLTFSISPLMVFVGRIIYLSYNAYGLNPDSSGGWNSSFIWMLGQTRSRGSYSNYINEFSLNGTTLSWTGTGGGEDNPFTACNVLDHTYRWIALGV